ncbi:hypothetical protein AAG906_012789 [Vitis piasezkii]
MKVSVKPSFLHLLQDTASIKKINWAQIVFFFLVRGISDFKSKKRSGGISDIFYLDHISTKKGMNLRFNVSRMKRKIKTLGGYDDPKVTIWIIKIGQSVDIEQNNGAENENDEKMNVVEKDDITSDHEDNDMRNVEDGDKQEAKVHEQQEEGHKVEEKRLSENDSCGDMELHVSPIVNNQCHDEKVNVDVPYVEKQEEQLSSLVVLLVN